MPNSLLPGGSGLPQPEQTPLTPLKRRQFLQYAGASASVAALALAGCSKKDDDNQPITPVTNTEVGSGDAGVLNYVSAVKLVTSAFYTALREGNYFKGLPTSNSAEKQILDDLEKHESVHKNYYKSLVGANSTSGLKQLETDFTSLDFNTRLTAPGAARMGVLNAAMLFEDLSVAAVNGSVRFLTNPAALFTLAKIVSVDARHAALIRDLVSYNSFVATDVVDVFVPSSTTPGEGDGTGMERLKTPTEVLTILNTYLKEGSKITAALLV
ncbi:hypothetical protein GCM10023185_41170 [Hymenobacter saemangeumensis]|uniref:Ferritin-like domain-containing protein n=1 Tax=Hymenobacter saemangeumensis TaxID=1084522 RepID=A0ABP8IS99_9BACT